MSQQRPGSSADDNHNSWIAAARREADALRAKSTHATPAGSSSRYLSDVELRRTLDEELTGYSICEDTFRGGQGVVFRATQVGTRRDVAIKMLREGPLVGAHGVARFERGLATLKDVVQRGGAGIFPVAQDLPLHALPTVIRRVGQLLQQGIHVLREGTG